METVKTLKAELEIVEENLAQLFDKKIELAAKIVKAQHAEDLQIYKSWELPNNAYVVLFRKDPLDECLVKTLYVKHIDEVKRVLNCTSMCYYYMDEEYWAKIDEETINFSKLADLQDRFNICVVDACQFTILQHKLCSLDITIHNVNSYYEELKKVADNVIS